MDKLGIIVDKLNRIEANTADRKPDFTKLKSLIDEAQALLDKVTEQMVEQNKPDNQMDVLLGMEFSHIAEAVRVFRKLNRRGPNDSEFTLLKSRIRDQ